MRLLLAEDEVELANALSAVLKHKTYSVDAVYNGIDAYNYAIAQDYDGIILDIMMPKMNGLELLQKLQKNHIEQTVIVVSTVAKQGAKETIQALEYGAFDFVTKPENYFETKGDDFKKRIHDMLNVATNSRASVERTKSTTGRTIPCSTTLSTTGRRQLPMCCSLSQGTVRRCTAPRTTPSPPMPDRR